MSNNDLRQPLFGGGMRGGIADQGDFILQLLQD